MARELDLGTLIGLASSQPAGATPVGQAEGAGPPLRGTLNASVSILELPLENPRLLRATADVTGLVIHQDGFAARLAAPDYLESKVTSCAHPTFVSGSKARLALPRTLWLMVGSYTPSPHPTSTCRYGSHLSTSHSLDGASPSWNGPRAPLTPTCAFAAPLSTALCWRAQIAQGGACELKHSPAGLSDVNVDVEVSAGELHVKSANARVGGGKFEVTGARFPFHGPGSAHIQAKGMSVPVAEGVRLTADAELDVA